MSNRLTHTEDLRGEGGLIAAMKARGDREGERERGGGGGGGREGEREGENIIFVPCDSSVFLGLLMYVCMYVCIYVCMLTCNKRRRFN